MAAAELHALRASLLRRIEKRKGRAGVMALRHRLYAVTHALMKLENGL